MRFMLNIILGHHPLFNTQRFFIEMEDFFNMKNSGRKIIGFVGVLGVLALCGIGLFKLENYEKVYYTRVDNRRIEKLDTKDEMKYQYTLESYSENGFKKTLKFKTVRELKEGYLKLVVRSLGVHSWEEVKFRELPDVVQKKYK